MEEQFKDLTAELEIKKLRNRDQHLVYERMMEIKQKNVSVIDPAWFSPLSRSYHSLYV